MARQDGRRRQGRRARRLAVALGASAAVHGLLVCGLQALPPAAPPLPAPRPEEASLAHLQVQLHPPGPPAPAGTPAEPPRPHARPPPPHRPAPRAASAVAPTPPLPRPGEDAGPREALAQEVPAAAPSALPDAPRARLFPSQPGLGGGEAGGAQAGRTLRAGEPPRPPPARPAEERAAEAQARVQRGLQEAASDYRVRTGLVDTYFAELASALGQGAASPPPGTQGASFVEGVLSTWSRAAKAYGETGTPGGPGPSGRPPAGHAGEFSLRAEGNMAASNLVDLERRQRAGASFRDFAEGRFGEGIVALVQLRHAGDGKLESLALVRSSGHDAFDDFALETASASAGKVGAAPRPLLGVDAAGFRTLWSFEGRVTFLTVKKPRELTLRDALGAAAMLALNAVTPTTDVPRPRDEEGTLIGHASPLTGSGEPLDTRHGSAPFTGRFEEARGEVGVVDLTQPRFDVRVKLLAVE